MKPWYNDLGVVSMQFSLKHIEMQHNNVSISVDTKYLHNRQPKWKKKQLKTKREIDLF